MNNDYLWDKTGHDPEIAEMENALRGLSYRETQPPALPELSELPAKVVAFPAKPATRFFRYAMAAAASLLFVALSFGIWFNLSRDANEGDEIVAKDSSVENKVLTVPETDPGTNFIKESAGGHIEKPAPILKRASAADKLTLPVAHKTKRPSAQKQPVTLTREEEYAYDQLKLALSITGSKLKLIKNKVENADARDPEAGGGR